MCKMPKQNKISIPLEIRISTRVFLNLVVAYSLVWFVINAMTDGLGEIGYASAIMAFAIVLGGVFRYQQVKCPWVRMMRPICLGVAPTAYRAAVVRAIREPNEVPTKNTGSQTYSVIMSTTSETKSSKIIFSPGV